MRAVFLSLVALVVAAPALAADGEPRKELTDKGQAIAKSLVLRKGDLSSDSRAHSSPDASLPKGARCDAVDESDLTVTGDASSPDFSFDALGVAVGSSASVYKTAHDSSTAWQRAGTPSAVRCFADLVRLTAPKAAAVRIVSATRTQFPRVAPKAIAYRVVATMTVGGKRRVRAYFDAVLLRHGSLQASLVVTSLAAPVPLAQERGLAVIVARRMAAAAAKSGLAA